MSYARLQRFLDRALIGAFAVVITAPLADRAFDLDPTPALTEKRAPAPAPAPPRSWEAWIAFPAAFEAYWNDRFGLRRLLVQAHHRHMARLGISPAPKSAIIGRRGWLFYGPDEAVAYYRNVDPFTPVELARWRVLLEARRDWLAERDIPYLLVVAPAKSTLYSEYMPRRITRVGDESRLDQLLADLAAHSDVAVLDLRPALRAAKAALAIPLYHPPDSHWNGRGALVAYRAILTRLRALAPDLSGLVPLPDEALRFEAYPANGDLAGLLSLEDMFRARWYGADPVSRRASRDVRRVDGATWIVTERRNAAGLPRALVVHDSFGDRLIPFLAEHFSAAVFAHTPSLTPAMVVRARPDVVIHEMAERLLMEPLPADPAALYDNARLRARFRQAPDLLVSVTPGHGPISIPRTDLPLQPDPSGAAAFLVEPASAAPGTVWLPTITVPRGAVALARIALRSPGATILSARYAPEDGGADEWQSAWHLQAGPNVLWLALAGDAVARQLGLTFASGTAPYAVESVAVRAEPPTPRAPARRRAPGEGAREDGQARRPLVPSAGPG